MKLRTQNKQWIVTDGQRNIVFENATTAFAYILTMAKIRAIPRSTSSIYPVRSLTPHPKKRTLTKKQLETVKKIKAEFPGNCI